MINLVMTVCLLATPANCREERPEIGDASFMSCVSQGQIYVVRWLAEHPAYDVRRWRCELSDARQMPI
jgi:hypothetical protein